MNAPSVYIIVLTYNMREVVRCCLQSLHGLSYPSYSVVVVDNASSDGTEVMLRTNFPGLTTIQTGGNLGYTGGNNRGIEYALTKGADYVLILNPDTEVVNPSFIDEMVAYLESHPEVGIAGPRVFLREAGVIQNTVLFAPGLWRNTINWVRYRLNPRLTELSGNEIVEAEVLNGVCLLMRVGCLRQIGLFDENIFMYIEDVEMDYRAHRHGWRIQYLPIDSVIHKRQPEGCHMTSTVSFLLRRNAVYYLCKVGKRLDAWGYALLSLAVMAARALSPFKRESFGEYMQFCKRLAAAYRQILSGRTLDKTFGPPYA